MILILNLHKNLTLVHSRAGAVLEEYFRSKKAAATIPAEKLLWACSRLEETYRDRLGHFRSSYALTSDDAEISLELLTTQTGPGYWTVQAEHNFHRKPVQLEPCDMSYYELIRIGLWAHEPRRWPHLVSVISKVVSGTGERLKGAK